ncbi:hypothetical protein GF389_01705 [Candidatus Dojkabacteria bacterium]|nr:hypothetical protein [Candidatus Dojkabacteria bacterium]
MGLPHPGECRDCPAAIQPLECAVKRPDLITQIPPNGNTYIPAPDNCPLGKSIAFRSTEHGVTIAEAGQDGVPLPEAKSTYHPR